MRFKKKETHDIAQRIFHDVVRGLASQGWKKSVAKVINRDGLGMNSTPRKWR